MFRMNEHYYSTRQRARELTNGVFHFGIINKLNAIENWVSNVLWKMIQVEEDILKFLKSQHAQQSWRKNVNETERSWSRMDFIYILNVKVKQKKKRSLIFPSMAWLIDYAILIYNEFFRMFECSSTWYTAKSNSTNL